MSRIKSVLSMLFKTADKKTKYDQIVKTILAHRIILAHILTYTVPEFNGMKPKNIVQFIEPEPKISKVAMKPGETNSLKGIFPMIRGLSETNSFFKEGTIYYDILFHVLTPTQETIKMYINVEAQNKFISVKYIISRAIFYVARLISAQMDRDFKAPEYDSISKVYSIWLCTNPIKSAVNTLTRFTLQQENIVGNFPHSEAKEIPNIVIVGLPPEIVKSAGEHNELKLHRLLETILSNTTTPEEKDSILESEYEIESGTFERGLQEMCDLSDAVEESGIEKGADIMQKAMILFYEKNCKTVESLIAHNIPKTIAEKVCKKK